MKSHLQLISTVNMTRAEWLAYRMTGLGASEIGAVLGYDDFTSSLELFHYKIGNVTKLDIPNLLQLLGKEQEPLVAKLWRYWQPGGDEQEMLANYEAGRIVRRCKRIHAFVRNPSYPWLFVSLDRIIQSSDERGEGNLELKTIGGWEADKWEARVPTKHVFQVQTQMLVPELQWTEMAFLEDGRKFYVLPFEPNQLIQEQVVERTKAFWDKVLAGRQLVQQKLEAQLALNFRRVEQLDHEIDALAPPPDGTLAYEKYLSERFKAPKKLERRGTAQEESWARTHLLYAAQLKALEENKRRIENQLKTVMGDVQVLDFGPEGKVHWSVTGTGARTFRNKLKP